MRVRVTSKNYWYKKGEEYDVIRVGSTTRPITLFQVMGGPQDGRFIRGLDCDIIKEQLSAEDLKELDDYMKANYENSVRSALDKMSTIGMTKEEIEELIESGKATTTDNVFDVSKIKQRIEDIKDAHYDNTNGSLYKFAEDHKLNAWEFDIIKRLVRCRKKGQFKEDLEKTKRVIDLYLKEFKV
jgi:hypothetical protein